MGTQPKKPTSKGPADWFTGDVWIDGIVEPHDNSQLNVKIPQALSVLRHYDLNRVHIVAPGPAPTALQLVDAVAAAQLPAGHAARDVDFSVLNICHECRSLVHRLSRPGRRAALNKLWEHLTLRQPNDALVREYVDLLAEVGLTVVE